MLVHSASVDSMMDNSTGSSSNDHDAVSLAEAKQIERSSQASPSDIMSHPLHEVNTGGAPSIPELPLMSYRISSSTASRNSCGSDDNNVEGNEVVEKPFFIMDFLEHVDPTAVELAQKLLQRPPLYRDQLLPLLKKGEVSLSSCPLLDELRAHAVHESRSSMASSGSSSTTDIHGSHFLQQSIAIGNGYNAKGIKKARTGRWEEALTCWRSALEIRTQVLCEDHIDVANTCNNIGIALGKLHRYDDAIKSLHRALEIRIGHYGTTEHVQVAATLHNIGNIYQQAGDFEAAIQYFCQCKVLQESIFGSCDHVEVARACIAIGHTYFQADAMLDAREAYLDALSIFHRIGLSEDNAEVQATINDIRDLDEKITGFASPRSPPVHCT